MNADEETRDTSDFHVQLVSSLRMCGELIQLHRSG